MNAKSYSKITEAELRREGWRVGPLRIALRQELPLLTEAARMSRSVVAQALRELFVPLGLVPVSWFKRGQPNRFLQQRL
jgi:hypothetical protein